MTRQRRALFTLLLACQTLALFGADQKPNIVFVLVDDQRNTSLGCSGHPQIKTPVIDRLAAQGVRFENAFVQTPICMASRANLFTGLTTTTNGYHAKPSTPVRREDLATSFPTLLRQAGYRTAFYGKQHVQWENGAQAGMTTMFDDHEVLHRNPYLKKMPDGTLRHVDEIIGDRSVAFVDRQSATQPFFLYMSFNISHAEDGDRRPGYHYQWAAPEDGMFEDIEPVRPTLDDPKYYLATPDFLKTTINRDRYFWGYDTPEKFRVNMRALYRMLASMDRIVGRVMTTLKEKGLAENTIVIYSADNGYYMGDRGFQGKWSHYDQSLHVPLIVYDPRLQPGLRGRVLKETVISLDIPATILDLATVPVPAKYQGVPLTPLLAGQTRTTGAPISTSSTTAIPRKSPPGSACVTTATPTPTTTRTAPSCSTTASAIPPSLPMSPPTPATRRFLRSSGNAASTTKNNTPAPPMPPWHRRPRPKPNNPRKGRTRINTKRPTRSPYSL